MRFKKKINNNVAMAEDSGGTECIVTGKGIGFSKKPGDLIHESEYSRRFFPDGSESLDSVSQTLSGILPEVLQICAEVSKAAERKLGIRFSNHHYIILADHIDYAITRSIEGLDYNDASRWEVKRLYPREYETAKEAVRTIEKSLEVQLPKSEEVFITYHFVNAQSDENKMNETIKVTRVINEILEFIEARFRVTLDEEAFSCMRMINHLRYLLIRKLHGETLGDFDDDSLEQAIRKKCPVESDTTEAIALKLEHEESLKLSSDEKMFLTLHIWRVFIELKKKS